MGDKSVRSGRKGGMTGIQRPKTAAKTQLRGLCPPESGPGDQTAPSVGEVAAVARRKVAVVEIRKTLRL
jgi:hypothetical protein